MLDKIGKIIPPCLTPLPTKKNLETSGCPIEHTSSGVYTRKAAV